MKMQYSLIIFGSMLSCWGTAHGAQSQGILSRRGFKEKIKSNVSDTVLSRVDSHFYKNGSKKPLLRRTNSSDSSSTSRLPQRQVHVANEEIRNSRLQTTSLTNYRNSYRRQDSCSPRSYRLTLRNGHCSRTVLTKMCHGTCTSYMLPKRSSSLTAEETLHVETSCRCCSSTKIVTKRYRVHCRGDEGNSRKTLLVPFAESCACRPCTR